MKKAKTHTDRYRKKQHIENISNINIESFLEIKSVSPAPTRPEPPKLPEVLPMPSDPVPTAPKHHQFLSYIKTLEEENKRLQSELISSKEENSQLLRLNKDLSIKNSSQQSYITRLNVEIAKLNRSAYPRNSGEAQYIHKPRLRTVSRKVFKDKNLLRSISNSCIERRQENESIGLAGLLTGVRPDKFLR